MGKELIRGRPFHFLGGVGKKKKEKNILKSDFEHKKVLQGNTCNTMALYVREKHSITGGLGETKILTQTHEITHTLVKVK